MRVKYIVLFALLAGYACKKVIQVDLKNAASQIVIEGEVTNHTQTYQVKITKTVDFSADNTFPPVSGATVRVTDSSTGHTTSYTESSPGVYTTTQFTGVPKHIYNLLVIAEGKEYRATSVMPLPVPLDSVTFARNTDLSNKQSINAIVNFQDPPGLGNYYQFTEYRNGRLLPNIFVFEDRLSDGRYIRQPLFNDSSYLQRGDTMLLKMYCIDKPVFDYFNTLIAVTGSSNFQSATPANPISNISNGALGYFSAHTVSEKELIVY
ncbi:MAG TPA: DUF4249 domain-containing protein [Puia sp.]|nr:DUF4249 domain-containing protein [Puia sp.]